METCSINIELEKYKDEKNVIILKGRDEADAFLSRLREKGAEK